MPIGIGPTAKPMKNTVMICAVADEPLGSPNSRRMSSNAGSTTSIDIATEAIARPRNARISTVETPPSGDA
jgi:hypothetical protein